METIMSVLGLGGSAPAKEESTPDQHPLSGREPASGQQGAGTATDPYDSGNLAGQSGSAAGNPPNHLPKTTTSPESFRDDNTLSPNPNGSTTTSSNLEPSSKPQEDLKSASGLQGHPLPITSFTPTPTAEEVVTPYKFEQGQDTASAKNNVPIRDTVPAQDYISTQGNAPAQDTIPAQDSVLTRDTPAQNTVAAPDTSSAKLDEQTQTKYNQPQSLVPEGSSGAASKGEVPQENASQGYAGSKTFVEREAARIAEETAPRDTAKDTGPSTSGAVNDTTDHDLAESTKKVHLKDKIKEKLHFRKKSEST